MSLVNRFSIEYLLSEDLKPTKRLREKCDNDDEAVSSRASKLFKLSPNSHLNLHVKCLHPGLRDITVNLEGAPLWKRFHALGTEMIVTKSGR